MNQYDEYKSFDFIPAPFEVYAKAGEAQQKKYDDSKEMGQELQDKLAAVPSREVDVPFKNALVKKYTDQLYDVFTNNQYYTPDMMSKVRQVARKAAQDPGFSAIGHSLEQQKNIRKIEDTLSAQGKKPYYYHRDWDEKPVGDQSGNFNWKDMYKTGLGVEAQADYYKEAEPYTKDIHAQLLSKGIKIDSTGISHSYKGKDGHYHTEKMPLDILVESQAKVLNPQAQWIKDEVQRVMEPFKNSYAGQQYLHLKGTHFDKNTNRQQERYSGFGDYGTARKAYQTHSLTDLINSTIKPVYEEQIKYDPMKSISNTGGGKGDPTNPSGSITLLEAFNPQGAGQEPSGGPMIPNPSYDPHTTRYSEFTQKDRGDLYKFSKEAYKKYLDGFDSGGERVEGMASHVEKALPYDKWLEKQGASIDNPYGDIQEEFLKANKKVADNMLAGMKVTAANPALSAYASSEGVKGLNSSNAIVIGGDYNMLPAKYISGSGDVENHPIEFSGQTADIPTIHGGTKRVFLYNMYVTEDEFKAAGFDPSEVGGEKLKQELDADGKKVMFFPMKVAVPARNVISSRSARQNDFKIYGPDKQIADEDSYDATYNMQSNIDKFNEYGYSISQDKNAEGNIVFTVVDKHDNSKGVKISQQEMANPATFDLVFKHHNKR